MKRMITVMKVVYVPLTFAGLIAVSGCGLRSVRCYDFDHRNWNSMNGLPEEYLVIKMGPPQATVPLAQGGHVDVWEHSDDITMPSHSYGSANTQYDVFGAHTTAQTTTTPGYEIHRGWRITCLIGPGGTVFGASGSCW